MNWITKLERKYGRFCIPNLINILIGGQILVYAIELFVNQYISFYLSLSRSALFAGQIWRLFTFVLVPFSGGGPLSVVLGIYFTWFVGSALEREWGDFRFNLYVLLGMAGAWLACLLTGSADTYCLSLSLLLAFAMLYPEMRLLLFFIIPVKVKWLALFSGVLCLFGFVFGTWADRLSVLFSLLNFLIFFGGDFWRMAKQELRYAKNRRAWRNAGRNNWR